MATVLVLSNGTSSIMPFIHLNATTCADSFCITAGNDISFRITPQMIQDDPDGEFRGDTKREAKSKKISVPKLIRSKMRTHTAYRERKEFWR